MCINFSKLIFDLPGDVDVDLAVGAVGSMDDDRGAVVGGFADVHMERDFSEEIGVEFFGGLPCAAMTEDF